VTTEAHICDATFLLNNPVDVSQKSDIHLLKINIYFNAENNYPFQHLQVNTEIDQ